MTLVSSIILQAYRESNLVSAAVAALDTTRETEALNRLNAIVASVLGWEAGENLKQWPVGTAGYFDPSPSIRSDVWKYPPINANLVLNVSQAETIYLPERPSDGARIAVQDLQGNLATYNVTLHGNGRLIEAASTLALSTNSLNRTWFYRADLGDWRRVSTLATSDELPFPVEFDDMFIILLAIRLNPRYGRKLDEQTAIMLRRAQKMFTARYAQVEDIEFSADFSRNPVQSYRGFWDADDVTLIGG
jgi:hypothetical protein